MAAELCSIRSTSRVRPWRVNWGDATKWNCEGLAFHVLLCNCRINFIVLSHGPSIQSTV